MPRDSRHDILFEPVTIGPKTLPNRFFQVPHCTGFGTAKAGSQAAHRGVKAEGGWGGVCTEDAPVSLDSDELPYNAAHVYHSRDADNLGLVAEWAHRHGAARRRRAHPFRCQHREPRYALANDRPVADRE